MKPGALFTAVLRQWGCRVDPSANPAQAALYLQSIRGGGTLVVDAKGGLYMEMHCPSIYDASTQVLVALAELTADSLAHGRDLLEKVKPEMFVWVPDLEDIPTTHDANRVIKKIKESIK